MCPSQRPPTSTMTPTPSTAATRSCSRGLHRPALAAERGCPLPAAVDHPRTLRRPLDWMRCLTLRIDSRPAAWLPEDELRVSTSRPVLLRPAGSDRGPTATVWAAVRRPAPRPLYIHRRDVQRVAGPRPDVHARGLVVGFAETAPEQSGEICIAELSATRSARFRRCAWDQSHPLTAARRHGRHCPRHRCTDWHPTPRPGLRRRPASTSRPAVRTLPGPSTPAASDERPVRVPRRTVRDPAVPQDRQSLRPRLPPTAPTRSRQVTPAG